MTPEAWTVWPAYWGAVAVGAEVVTVDVYPLPVDVRRREGAAAAAQAAVDARPEWGISPGELADMALMTQCPAGRLRLVEPHRGPGGQVDWHPVRTCQTCGCTDDRACTPPCHWVGTSLCSACDRPAEPPSRPAAEAPSAADVPPRDGHGAGSLRPSRGEAPNYDLRAEDIHGITDLLSQISCRLLYRYLPDAPEGMFPDGIDGDAELSVYVSAALAVMDAAGVAEVGPREHVAMLGERWSEGSGLSLDANVKTRAEYFRALQARRTAADADQEASESDTRPAPHAPPADGGRRWPRCPCGATRRGRAQAGPLTCPTCGGAVPPREESPDA